MRIKDIAEKAGVSKATVSNVINGNFHKVSKETVQRINEIIKEYNYEPNAMAKGLATKESKLIGVVVPNTGDHQTFALSPYNVMLLASIENYIRMNGYNIMLRCVVQSKDVLGYFNTWNVDGIIFFGTFEDEVKQIQQQTQVPTMYIDTYTEDVEIANVGADDYIGGYLSTKYLLDRGHKELIFVGPSVKYPGVIQERYKGFCDAMNEKGYEVKEHNRLETDTDYEIGIKVGRTIALSGHPYTGIVCTADILSIGIIEGLRKYGKKVPEDISIIGYDNLLIGNYCYPKLSSISQSIEEKGIVAAKTIIEMAQKRKQIVMNKKVTVEVVERESVRSLI